MAGRENTELGAYTLVRAYSTKFRIGITNDGPSVVSGLKMQATLGSYVGQDKPILVGTAKPVTLANIPSRGAVANEVSLTPNFPGLVVVSVQLSDARGALVQARRRDSEAYTQGPVQWWCHVIDDMAIETKDTLRRLEALLKKEK